MWHLEKRCNKKITRCIKCMSEFLNTSVIANKFRLEIRRRIFNGRNKTVRINCLRKINLHPKLLLAHWEPVQHSFFVPETWWIYERTNVNYLPFSPHTSFTGAAFELPASTRVITRLYWPLLRNNFQHEGFVTSYGNNNKNTTLKELLEGYYRGKVTHLNYIKMENP